MGIGSASLAVIETGNNTKLAGVGGKVGERFELGDRSALGSTVVAEGGEADVTGDDRWVEEDFLRFRSIGK